MGLDQILSFVAGRRLLWKLTGTTALALALVITIAPSFAKLGEPWVDDSIWPVVRVAEYLSRVSQKNDRIYAVFEVPVLAFYTGRDSIPLAWMYHDFPRHWRACMKHRGFYVDFANEPKDLPRLDRKFLETHREFTLLKDFGFAWVYRYVPD